MILCTSIQERNFLYFPRSSTDTTCGLRFSRRTQQLGARGQAPPPRQKEALLDGCANFHTYACIFFTILDTGMKVT